MPWTPSELSGIVDFSNDERHATLAAQVPALWARRAVGDADRRLRVLSRVLGVSRDVAAPRW